VGGEIILRGGDAGEANRRGPELRVCPPPGEKKRRSPPVNLKGGRAKPRNPIKVPGDSSTCNKRRRDHDANRTK